MADATHLHLQSLYQEAIKKLLRGRADLACDSAQKLHRALPQSTEVQKLLQLVAVMSFKWSATRSPHALEKRDPPEQSSIDIVAFHVDMPRAPSGIHADVDYMAVLGQSFESACIRAPNARRLLITDEKTQIPDSLPVHEVLRYPLDPELLMFERMRVQELYLRSRDASRSSLLIDTDVVINADPVDIFVEEFDIGLTWRSGFPDAPFNGGIIFVPEGTGGHAFIAKALQCYEALAVDENVSARFPKSLKAWWGDQFALAHMVGYRSFFGRGDSQAVTIDGLRVRFFPCSEFNFTLEAGYNCTKDELSGKRLIHFKGNRKAFQAQYLKAMRAGTI